MLPDLINWGQYMLDPEQEKRKNNNNIDNGLVTLSRVSAAICSLGDLEAILQIGLGSLLESVGATAGGIMLLDEQTETLSYRIYCGLPDTFCKAIHLRLGEGIAGKVAQSGRLILVEDVSQEPSTDYPDMEGLKSFISIPLQAKGKVQGVLNIASDMPRRLDKRDMHLLHSIGDLLGMAIEHTKLNGQLKKGRERYRQLARQVIMAAEEERRRIARELHDETSQTLTGLALNLQVLIETAETAGIRDPEFKARLKTTQALAVQIHKEVSRLIVDLRPSALDTLGLVPALRQYAETNLTCLGIGVSFEFQGVEGSLPPEVEVGLFRWAQGAIGNIVQHSQAKHATISLRREGNELVLCIRDDGKGFDVSEITQVESSGRGAGLFGMKERVRLLGGNCSVQSQSKQGTTATARVPLDWSTANAEDKSTGG